MSSDILYSAINLDFSIAYREQSQTAYTPPHIHNAAEIYLNLSELPHALVGDQLSSVAPDSLIIIPAYCVHQLLTGLGYFYRRYVFNINEAWLDSLLLHSPKSYDYLKNTAAPSIIYLKSAKRQALSASFDQLIALESADAFQRFSAFFKSMVLIDEIVRTDSPDLCRFTKPVKISESQKTVNKIIAYINENIGKPISVSEISNYCYLNVDYISKIFKQYTHTTICNFITIQKMAQARKLLTRGYTITQVQQMTGYSSYAHFFRTFKKQVGITPGEYQRRLL